MISYASNNTLFRYIEVGLGLIIHIIHMPFPRLSGLTRAALIIESNLVSQILFAQKWYDSSGMTLISTMISYASHMRSLVSGWRAAGPPAPRLSVILLHL